MNVHIHQTRADHQPFGVNSAGVGGRLPRRVGSDGGNFVTNQQQIGDGIDTICGIDDAAAGEQERIHLRGRIHGR